MPISLTAGTRPTPSTFDPTALSDRIAKLEAAIAGSEGDEIIQLDRPLAEADFIKPWKHCNEIVKDLDLWVFSLRVWERVDNDSAKLTFEQENMALGPATHANATEIAPEQFKTRIRGGGEITYKTTRTASDTDSLKFPSGAYSHYQYYFLDENKNKIGNFGSNKILLPTMFTGQSATFGPPYPTGTKFIRHILSPSNGAADVIYDYPVK